MKIGMIGLGKLGLPVSVALGYSGFSVIGYDKSQAVGSYIAGNEKYPFMEAGVDGLSFQESLHKYPPFLRPNMAAVAAECDVIFISVQTPHEEKYCGAHRIPDDRRDFDYSYLIAAMKELVPHLTAKHTVAIISTCMPGTIRREILPLISHVTADNSIVHKCRLIYNPFFIAMGTVIPDFLNPEFVLLGRDNDTDYPAQLIDIYFRIYRRHVRNIMRGNVFRIMSYESAELTKVAYNTFIGFKIALANTFGMICDRIAGANCDDVMNALVAASDRLISAAYLTSGMGDGGACHPRDLIAMAWLQGQHFALANPFDDVMRWREMHAQYLAYRMQLEAGGLPLAIYGLAFKKNTAMLDGSHAVLVSNIIQEYGRNLLLHDPIANIGPPAVGPHCILIGCAHDAFKTIQFPAGSIIIDPFRYLPAIPDCKLIRLGIGREYDQAAVPAVFVSPAAA